jgi:limonene-1,2-epoxide hydrolase
VVRRFTGLDDLSHPTSEAITRVVDFFEHLQPADLAQLGRYYADDAHFKDPFNEVQGLAAIEGIFRHVCGTGAPALRHHRPRGAGATVLSDLGVPLRLRSYAQGVEQTIRGATHLVLDDAQRITLHRDYWDAAEELYEKLPGLRVLMRWLKKRASQ